MKKSNSTICLPMLALCLSPLIVAEPACAGNYTRWRGDDGTGEMKWETGLGKLHDAWAYHKSVQLQHNRQLSAINLTACMGKTAKDADTLGILDSKPDRGKVRGVGKHLIDKEMDPGLDFDGSLDATIFNGAVVKL